MCLPPAQEAYHAAWRALEASSSSAGAPPLRERDVPWPTAAGREATDTGPLLLAGVPPAARKAALREELMRWHPDKFGARFGARLAPGDAARVAARVNIMSQTVAALFQDAKAA